MEMHIRKMKGGGKHLGEAKMGVHFHLQRMKFAAEG